MGNEQQFHSCKFETIAINSISTLPYNILGIDKPVHYLIRPAKSISKNIVSKLETSPQVLDGIDQLTEELCKISNTGLS
jgi:hypothetical protein